MTQHNNKKRVLKNRLNDRFFKALFGVKGHEKYLISLLNSLFESYLKGRSIVINKLTFLNREVDALKDDGKACRMDILAQIDDGSIIDVEVQLLNINDEMTKRSLYYFGKLYTERLKSGESYHVLRPCIIVNLLNFNLFDDLDAYLTRYQMQELTYGRIYSDDADIFVVELPKWKEWIKKQNTQDIKNVNRFCRWLSYLTSSDPELVRRLALHDRLIQEALMIEKRYTMDDERWYAYEMHEKYLHDQATLKECGIREGLEKGIEQGIEIGTKNTLLQNIRGLLKIGVEEKTIKAGLNCTDEQIAEAKALN